MNEIFYAWISVLGDNVIIAPFGLLIIAVFFFTLFDDML
jgi:hypothetical protein